MTLVEREQHTIKARNCLIFGAVCVFAVLIACWTNVAQAADPTFRVMGVDYSPSDLPTVIDGRVDKPLSRIKEDMQRIGDVTGRVRTYAISPQQPEMIALARQYHLKMMMGLWIGRDKVANEAEIEKGIVLAKANHDVIDRVIVGNEVMHRRDMPAEESAAYIVRVKKALRGTRIQVSTADTPDEWIDFPQRARVCDFIAVNILPFWDGVPVERGTQQLEVRYNQLHRAFPSKKIVITETGWPSAGKRNQGSVPSLDAQVSYLQQFLTLARAKKYDYYLLEAFDQPWKTDGEGVVGANWGLMDDDGQPKIEVKREPVQAENTMPAATPSTVSVSVKP